MKRFGACACFAHDFVRLATSADAQSVADFYRGKQIRDDRRHGAGRLRYLGEDRRSPHAPYIPGNPVFVVENMPGAGSLIAANYLYNKAAQDGTVLGSVSRNIPNFAFTKKPNVFFDPLKFNWIGSPEMTNRGCYARADSGVEKPDDLFEHELLVGTRWRRHLAVGNAYAVEESAGDEIQDHRRLSRLQRRRSRHGSQRGFGNLPDRHGVRAIGAEHCWMTARYGCCSRRNVNGCRALKVPTIFEFAKTEEQRNILAFHASSLETGRPWLAPPGCRSIGSTRYAAPSTQRCKTRRFSTKPNNAISTSTRAPASRSKRCCARLPSLPEELTAKAAEMIRK